LNKISDFKLFPGALTSICEPGKNASIPNTSTIIIVGTDEELDIFQGIMQKQEKEHRDRLTQSTNKNIKIEQFNIEPGSQLIGQSIQQSGIREKNACLILGIERDGRPIMNLSSQTVFEENDSVWVAGEYRQIVQLSEDSSSN
jgi:CPA2 family monovalent cation:H+ antiporter-2